MARIGSSSDVVWLCLIWLLLSVAPAWAYYPGPQGAQSQATPTNPTGTSSTTGVMMGLAGSVTPKFSGRVQVTMSGDCFSGTIADGANIQMRYGTGTAPSNAGALAGTTIGSAVSYRVPTTASRNPYAQSVIIT